MSKLMKIAGVLSMLCACAEPAPQEAAPPDAEQDEFVQTVRGKADAQGIEEMSWEGMCVLKFVNTADAAEIRDVVHSIPASNIIETRAGSDGTLGTDDDQPFATLEALDDVSFVGAITFSLMSRHARANQDRYCLALGQEQLLPGEEEAAAQITAQIERAVRENAAENGVAIRDAHAKAHGCVKAFVDVDPVALDPEHQIGLFANPGTYPAWIRLSNGAFSKSAPDTERDVRGFALKLMDVKGEKILERHKTQETVDFLFISGPSMFSRTPQDYVEFSEKAFDGNPVSFFLSLDPREWKLRELFNLLEAVNKEPLNPLRMRYWSTTPYALGPDMAVKYSVTPCDGEELTGWFGDHPDDLLRDSLGVLLDQTDWCYDFMVQRQIDPGVMPVEDATVTWEESDSPFVKVATIRIPQQTFDTPAQDEFCENLSFNPWHTLPEHRPLGNINRTRRAVYDTISDLRHMLNEAPREEPTSHDIP